MSEQRKTYESKKGTYILDGTKLFEIVADMYTTIRIATNHASLENDSKKFVTSLAWLSGKNGLDNKGSLVIRTEVNDEPCFFYFF